MQSAFIIHRVVHLQRCKLGANCFLCIRYFLLLMLMTFFSLLIPLSFTAQIVSQKEQEIMGKCSYITLHSDITVIQFDAIVNIRI